MQKQTVFVRAFPQDLVHKLPPMARPKTNGTMDPTAHLGFKAYARFLADNHYGSGKLFRFLGKHLVNDLIHLHVKIHAEKPRF